MNALYMYLLRCKNQTQDFIFSEDHVMDMFSGVGVPVRMSVHALHIT